MRILDLEQRSHEWFQARSLIPTASNFSKIVSSSGKKSTSADGYMNDIIGAYLAGEMADGEDDIGVTSRWIQRGIETEAQAIAYYELTKGIDVTEVGLCVRDDDLAACSPDALVGAQGGLELKCPKLSTHIKYLLEQRVPPEYVPQVQGSLWVTGRQWWDFMSYHPDVDPLLIRVWPDEIYINALAKGVEEFHGAMKIKLDRLTKLGVHHA